MKKMMLALAGGLTVSAMPVSAAVFTPFTMNLSATNASTATYTYTFDAGSYNITLIKDLYTAFAPTTPNANNWTDYYQYSIGGGAYQFYNPLGSGQYKFATADDAFNAFSAQQPLRLNFANQTTVTFQIGDSLQSLSDNAGGTSLRVSAVPELGTWMMMVLGFGAIGHGMRRRAATKVRFA